MWTVAVKRRSVMVPSIRPANSRSTLPAGCYEGFVHESGNSDLTKRILRFLPETEFDGRQVCTGQCPRYDPVLSGCLALFLNQRAEIWAGIITSLKSPTWRTWRKYWRSGGSRLINTVEPRSDKPLLEKRKAKRFDRKIGPTGR
jgi:hypothetical protein